jgi:hypothetical protein
MYFHVIGIKEVQNKKYNMDIVLQWVSESFVRDFLHTHNIVLLEISEHKDSPDSFGKLELIVKYKQNEIYIVSYLTDIEIAAYNFMMIWFQISYINFLWDDKLWADKVSKIIDQARIKTEESYKQLKQNLKQQKDKEKRIYKDERLEKILDIAETTFKEKYDLLSFMWDRVSKDKIRDLNIMLQNLTKLKMWRNVDKISEVLEEIYHKSYDIQTEYLNSSNLPVSLPISGSIITNIDIISEATKFTKAQNIKKIWAQRDSDDNYYLSFELIWVYIKLLLKDIRNILKEVKYLVYNTFNYLQLFFMFVIISVSLIFRFNKVSYSIGDNIYWYLFITKIWVFWLCFFILNRFKSLKIYHNIFLILFALILSYLILRFLKSNLSF